jgi:phospholipase/lecithinase/hemolysin
MKKKIVKSNPPVMGKKGGGVKPKPPVSNETRKATKQVQTGDKYSELQGRGSGKYGRGYRKAIYQTGPASSGKRNYALSVGTPDGKVNQWAITEKEASRQRKIINAEAGYADKKGAATPMKKPTPKKKMGGVKKTTPVYKMGGIKKTSTKKKK